MKILCRMIGAEAHISIRCEMDHEVTPGHRLRQRIGIEIVPTVQREARLLPGRDEELFLPGRKIIPSHDLPAEREQPIRRGAADESGDAGDENFLHWDGENRQELSPLSSEQTPRRAAARSRLLRT